MKFVWTEINWSAFGKPNFVCNSELPLCLKRNIFHEYVLPVLTYGPETLTLIKKGRRQDSNLSKKPQRWVRTRAGTLPDYRITVGETNPWILTKARRVLEYMPPSNKMVSWLKSCHHQLYANRTEQTNGTVTSAGDEHYLMMMLVIY